MHLPQLFYLIKNIVSLRIKILKKNLLLFQKNLRWRKENKVSTINDEDWTDLQEEHPYTSDGVDLEGYGSQISAICACAWK